jgi:hypothetical protein
MSHSHNHNAENDVIAIKDIAPPVRIEKAHLINLAQCRFYHREQLSNESQGPRFGMVPWFDLKGQKGSVPIRYKDIMNHESESESQKPFTK